MYETIPTHETSFVATIRRCNVQVEASAWADHEGIYKTRINAVYLDDANVIGLLTDEDLSELDGMIYQAVANDLEDERISAFDPARDAFQIGD